MIFVDKKQVHLMGWIIGMIILICGFPDE